MNIRTIHLLSAWIVMTCGEGIYYLYKDISRGSFRDHLVLNASCICSVLSAIIAFFYDPFLGVSLFFAGILEIFIGVKDGKNNGMPNPNWVYGPYKCYTYGVILLIFGTFILYSVYEGKSLDWIYR